MRVLITGASGFVGAWLARACAEAGDEVVPVSRAHGVDLRDERATATAVREARPDVVYHLAALASVARSWAEPGAVLSVNLTLSVNVLEAVRVHAPAARVLAVSSGEVYGPPATLPVTEDATLRPQSPYAVSKAAGDLLAGLYGDAHGLHVVRARAFNHAGPGQQPTYVLSSLCRQLAAARLAGRPLEIVCGNPDTRRDHCDVRDVVRAYRLLVERGERGQIYNVCAGASASAGELIELVALAAGEPVTRRVDPALVRAHEVSEVRGSFARLAAATGWAPEIPLARTVADTLAWWEQQLSGVESGAAPE